MEQIPKCQDRNKAVPFFLFFFGAPRNDAKQQCGLGQRLGSVLCQDELCRAGWQLCCSDLTEYGLTGHIQFLIPFYTD